MTDPNHFTNPDAAKIKRFADDLFEDTFRRLRGMKGFCYHPDFISFRDQFINLFLARLSVRTVHYEMRLDPNMTATEHRMLDHQAFNGLAKQFTATCFASDMVTKIEHSDIDALFQEGKTVRTVRYSATMIFLKKP
ncbi:MAG: hypothetical protein RLZZ157_102 [Pseudomonadota bacterium]|jgi:hypothetical protein